MSDYVDAVKMLTAKPKPRYVSIGGEKPIIPYVRYWVAAIFPTIPENSPRSGSKHKGVVGDPEVAGRVSRPSDLHPPPDGRAADIYLNAFDARQRRIGDALSRTFVQWAAPLGVEHVIWNTQNASAKTGWRWERYTGPNPHTNHVHVTFTVRGAQLQPPLLVPLLDRVHLDVYGTLSGER